MVRAIVVSEPHNLSEDELQRLAEEVGAIPARNLPFDPRNSIPLLAVEGSQHYRRKLSRAAHALHRSLQDDTSLRDALGRPVIVRGREIGKVPDVRKAMSKASDAPALGALLHSLAHVASHPVTPEGRRLSCVAAPMSLDVFRSGREYEHLNGPAFRKYVLALVFLDQLEFVPSYRDTQAGQARRSRVGSSRPFLHWLVQKGLVFPLHPHGPSRGDPLEAEKLVMVSYGERDAQGRKPKRPVGRPLLQEEQVLLDLNEALAKQRVSCTLSSYREYENNYDFRRGQARWPAAGFVDTKLRS